MEIDISEKCQSESCSNPDCDCHCTTCEDGNCLCGCHLVRDME